MTVVLASIAGDLIVSANVERRHLDAGQRALLALDFEAAHAEAAKATEAQRKLNAPSNQHTTKSSAASADRHPSPPTPSAYERKSATRAARATGASGRSVQRAKAVQRDTPDLADKVRRGEMALGPVPGSRSARARSPSTCSGPTPK